MDPQQSNRVLPQSTDVLVLLNKVKEELDHGDRRLFDSLSDHEKEILVEIFQELSVGDTTKHDLLWEIDYTRRPVSFSQYIDDPYYMGEIGKTLFPIWRRDLEEKIFAPKSNIFEVIVTGAIGTGKTTAMFVGLSYKAYVLSCLRNPARFYGLMEGPTQFVFGLFNATLQLSEDAHYGKIVGMLNSSPYFRWLVSQSMDKLKKDKDVLDLPNNIHISFGSQALHALGQDMIGVLLDEMNFRKVSEDTNTALEVYNATKRRIQSRFPALPGIGRNSPGILFLISSRKGESDFLDKHIIDSGGMEGVCVLSYSEWEMKKHIPGKYSGSMFRVMVGDERVSSKVLDEVEKIPDTNEYVITEKTAAPETYKVIKVPVEHFNDFKLDPDGALMDIAGVPIKGAGYNLINREKVHHAIKLDEIYFQRKRVHPFTKDTVILGLRNPTVIEDYLKLDQLVECVDVYRSIYRPLINPSAERFIHLDPASSGSCKYGLTMGHVAGIKSDIKRRDLRTGMVTSVAAPIICLDFVLGIFHDQGDEIDYTKVRQFIHFLQDLGFPIKWITSDQFQSVDTLQIFSKLGYSTKRISLDGDPQNYIYVKQAYHEDRVLMYEYQPYLDEIIYIQTDTKGRVFPLAGHFKDLSDSAAGVIANIMSQPNMEIRAAEPVNPNEAGTIVPKALQDPEESLVSEILDEVSDIDMITDIR